MSVSKSLPRKSSPPARSRIGPWGVVCGTLIGSDQVSPASSLMRHQAPTQRAALSSSIRAIPSCQRARVAASIPCIRFSAEARRSVVNQVSSRRSPPQLTRPVSRSSRGESFTTRGLVQLRPSSVLRMNTLRPKGQTWWLRSPEAAATRVPSGMRATVGQPK